MRKIWLDTDPGFDDWLTMLMLANNSALDWLGVSVVAGNAPLATTYDNALRIQAHYGLTVPIYPGCDQPLAGAIETAQAILGDSGMRTTGMALPPAVAAADNGAANAAAAGATTLHGVDALIAAVRAHPGQITLVAIAPLTNIATALQRAPDIAPLLDGIVMMGGSADHGNHTAAAEFNIYADPEAADVVFRAGIPIRMFGLNLCRQLLVTQAELRQLAAVGTPRATWLAGYFDGYLRIRSDDGSVPMPMYDPLVALYLSQPALFTFQPARVVIELDGTHTRGMTVCEFRVPKRGVANVDVAMRIDAPRALPLLMAEIIAAL
jgi:purine nucleosidase